MTDSGSTDTGDNPEEVEPLTKKERLEWVNRLGPDPSLARLVAVANRSGSGDGLPIVLTLSGQIIGGNLVSGSQWFDDMNAAIKTGTGGALSTEELFAPEMAQYSAQASDDPPDAFAVAFLHLANAYRVEADGDRPLAALRVRLNQIVAWALGDVRLA